MAKQIRHGSSFKREPDVQEREGFDINHVIGMRGNGVSTGERSGSTRRTAARTCVKLMLWIFDGARNGYGEIRNVKKCF